MEVWLGCLLARRFEKSRRDELDTRAWAGERPKERAGCQLTSFPPTVTECYMQLTVPSFDAILQPDMAIF